MSIYKQAIEKWGEDKQIDMIVEETGELLQALMKYRRGKPHNVEEELADVQIMIQQLKFMFDFDLYQEFKFDKIQRLKLRLKEDE